MKYFDFIELANNNGLEVIDTTSEMSGYPRNIQKAIIGFDTYEEAKKLADENGLSIEYFEKKDGWNMWYRTGNSAWEPFHNDDISYDDQTFIMVYYRKDLGSLEEIEALQERLDDEKDEEEKEKIHEQFDALKKEVSELDENECLIMDCDRNTYRYPITSMSYHYDTKTSIIGLIDNE